MPRALFNLNNMVEYAMDSIIGDISEVPEAWIYKHYYKYLSKEHVDIHQPFDGRIIKVRSLTNRDTNPSLCFFYKNSRYLWRDFSQGQGGNAIRFVAYHYNKSDGVAINMITRDYELYLNSGEIPSGETQIYCSEIKRPEFKVESKMYGYEDLKIWEHHKINLGILNRFKIKALSEYQMKRGNETLKFEGNIYGFFNSKGCYQIYQPFIQKAKYIQIDTSYLIGSEQLEFKYNVCAIISGLKDIAAITAVNINCEYVAPPSENTLLSKDNVEFLKSKYLFVVSMLDNDEAGLRAMRLYKKMYDIPYIHVNMKKDLALNNIHYSLDGLRYAYTKLINDKINPR